MTIEEFEDGIKRVEAALQGSFDEKFVDCLWRHFDDHEADVWERTCTTLCRTAKPARSLILHDFIQLATLEARRSRERDREEAARGGSPADVRKLDLPAIADKVAKKTGKPFCRDLAKDIRMWTEP